MSFGPRARRLVSHLAFPAVLGGAVAVALMLIRDGVDPRLAILAGQVPAFVIVIVLERLAPHHADWNRNHGDLGPDLGHMLTVSTISGLADPLLRLIGISAATALAGGAGPSLWPTGWPLLAQLALALVLGELGQYWVHRLEHEHDCLWRFHALHHSAPRLYWLNAARFHPVDILLNNFVVSVPLAALGAGLDVLSLWLLVSAVHGIFQHANVPVRIGPLNWVFSMAELHRWHHSKTVRESNANYGQNLIVWDVVFGTRFLPPDREPPKEVGIADLPSFPTSWLAQELSPLRWSEIRSGARAGDPAGR